MIYLVDFVDSVSQEQIDGYLAAYSGTVVKSYSAFAKTFLISCDSVPEKTEIVEHLVQDSDNPIQLQNVFRPLEFSTASDAEWWKVASFAKPDFEQPIQHYNRFGTHATVYMVDSGVDASHSDFAVNTPQQLFTFNGDFTDHNGHGTALASLIVGESCGITDATVKSVKIFQSGVPTLQSDLVAAFDAIIADMQAEKANIVNLSWSIPRNEFIESKIRQVVFAGGFVVAAAGNSGVAIDSLTPASMPEVVTVGAYDQNLFPCNFSNYTGPVSTSPGEVNGGELDCWAPGADIRAAIGGNAYGNIAGTSAAAAIVSAAIAYNTTTLVTGSGFLPSVLPREIILENSIGREGLLTLSGQYAPSVNKTARLLGEYAGQNGASWRFASKLDVFAHHGQPVDKILFNPLDVESFTLSAPLPAGLEMDGVWLRGQVTVTEPAVFTAVFSVTSYNGGTREIPLNVYLIPAAMTPEEYATDMELDIALHGCIVTGPGLPILYQCTGTCPGGGICVDSCFGETGVSGKDPSLMQCDCSPPYWLCNL